MEKSKAVIASALALSIAGCEGATPISNQKGPDAGTVRPKVKEPLNLVRSQVALTFCRELAETPVVPEIIQRVEGKREHCDSTPQWEGFVTSKRFDFDNDAVTCSYARKSRSGTSLLEFARSLSENDASDVITIEAEEGTDVVEFGASGVTRSYEDAMFQFEDNGRSERCHVIESVDVNGVKQPRIYSDRADGVVDYYTETTPDGKPRFFDMGDDSYGESFTVAERRAAQNRFSAILLEARERLADVVRTSDTPKKARGGQRHR